MNTDDHWMRLAIETARRGIEAGQTPFGACVVRDGQLVVAAHNEVWRSTDITAHAEVVSIREACGRLKTIDLSGCTMYATCEPCPMCFSACHWARIARIVYGADIADAQSAGFHELTIANEWMKREGQSAVELVAGVLRAEAAELFRTWLARPDHRTY